MKNTFLLLATAIVLSTTASFGSNLTIPSNIQIGVSSTDSKSDMIEQVRVYMATQNIISVYITEEAGTTNYLVKDADGIWYRVFTANGIVSTYEQMDY